MAELDKYDSDEEEPEDERPQVVVLKKNHLTEEEVEQIRKEQAENPADVQDRLNPDGNSGLNGM